MANHLTFIIAGQRFGRLVAVTRVENSAHRDQQWLFKCDCGTEVVKRVPHIRVGHTKSCGCLNRELSASRMSLLGKASIVSNFTHGMTKTPEHRVWRNLIYRCTNPRAAIFKDYGGRGITVCDRWRNSFEAFFADMGPRPALGYSIDRINNDGNYEPGNCRWATPKEQSNNQRPRRRKTLRESAEAV